MPGSLGAMTLGRLEGREAVVVGANASVGWLAIEDSWTIMVVGSQDSESVIVPVAGTLVNPVAVPELAGGGVIVGGSDAVELGGSETPDVGGGGGGCVETGGGVVMVSLKPPGGGVLLAGGGVVETGGGVDTGGSLVVTFAGGGGGGGITEEVGTSVSTGDDGGTDDGGVEEVTGGGRMMMGGRDVDTTGSGGGTLLDVALAGGGVRIGRMLVTREINGSSGLGSADLVGTGALVVAGAVVSATAVVVFSVGGAELVALFAGAEPLGATVGATLGATLRVSEGAALEPLETWAEDWTEVEVGVTSPVGATRMPLIEDKTSGTSGKSGTNEETFGRGRGSGSVGRTIVSGMALPVPTETGTPTATTDDCVGNVLGVTIVVSVAT